MKSCTKYRWERLSGEQAAQMLLMSKSAQQSLQWHEAVITMATEVFPQSGDELSLISQIIVFKRFPLLSVISITKSPATQLSAADAYSRNSDWYFRFTVTHFSFTGCTFGSLVTIEG